MHPSREPESGPSPKVSGAIVALLVIISAVVIALMLSLYAFNNLV